MEEKSILITGCSSGIGAYCARALAKNGWQVFATARKAEDIDQLRSEGIRTFFLDYCDTQSIHQCAEEVLAATDNRLFALFNNGAYGQTGAVEDLPTQALREQFEANLFGWHELTNLILPAMRSQGRGRIVHCSSVLGFVPFPWRGAYNASKFALEGLARTMRLELEPTNIYVSLIQPGPIETKFSANALPHFIEHIDVENSIHAQLYQRKLAALKSNGGANRFRLGPEAVHQKLIHALTAQVPKISYKVTFPTYFMAWCRRMLPGRTLEKLLLKND